MTLAPKLPPGRANRKALQFAVDIHHLRNAGYTFSAIRMALLEAGINVSLTTVKREAARKQMLPTHAHPSNEAQRLPPAFVPTPATVPGIAASATAPPALAGTSGREIAEAFFNANPSNPLLRAKDNP